MRVEEFRRALDKRSASRGLAVVFQPPASSEALQALSERLGGPLPFQVELFLRAHDGLIVREPALSILPCAEWTHVGCFMHFATVDGQHRLGFDTGRRNDADQWDIVHVDTGERVTLTMASFWSNKVFAWLDKRRPIWEPRGAVPPCGVS
ncbi:hypothetical protein ACLEPN_10910 [Myxococcus sp. 1LA]